MSRHFHLIKLKDFMAMKKTKIFTICNREVILSFASSILKDLVFLFIVKNVNMEKTFFV